MTQQLKHLQRRKPIREPTKKIEGPVARLSTADLREGATQSLTAVYMEEAKPLYETTQGFIGSYLLVNRAESQAKSITLWADEAAMDAASQNPKYAPTMAKVGSHFKDVPEIEVWRLAGSFLPSKDE